MNGRNSYISSDEIKLTENNKVSIYLKEYNSATVSPSPFVSVTVIDPKTKREYTKSERVIPVGSKHEYRDFNIKKIISRTEEATKKSGVELLSNVDYKPFFISINEKKGELYEVSLDGNVIFYDSSWERIKKKSVQNGKSEQLFLPYDYKGFVNIRAKGKFVNKIPTAKNPHSKYAGPLVYSKDWMNNFKLTQSDIKNGTISISSPEKMRESVKVFLENNQNSKFIQEVSDNRTKAYVIEIKGEFKHEVRQFEKSYDNQQAEQISLMV